MVVLGGQAAVLAVVISASTLAAPASSMIMSMSISAASSQLT